MSFSCVFMYSYDTLLVRGTKLMGRSVCLSFEVSLLVCLEGLTVVPWDSKLKEVPSTYRAGDRDLSTDTSRLPISFLVLTL